MLNRNKIGFFLILFIFVLNCVAHAQWTNRYPKVKGYGMHVYLEGYELPLLSNGPIDPAAAPDGKKLVLSSRGWLWLFNLKTGEAQRITKGAAIDTRPCWSNNGKFIVFVRDDGSDTSIMLLDTISLDETVLVNTPAIELDPVFSPDDNAVYYSSAEAGDLDIWRIELATGEKTRMTSYPGLELKTSVFPDGKRLLFIHKSRDAEDQISLLDIETGTQKVLVARGIASQMRPVLSPDGQNVVVGLPSPNNWQLCLFDVANPELMIQLTRDCKQAIHPSWSPDKQTIFYVEADNEQKFILKKVDKSGGASTVIPVRNWDWEEATGRLIVKTYLKDEEGFIPARLCIIDKNGHPVVPDSGQTRFDSQNGLNYFYSPGIAEVTIPEGKVKILATHGLITPAVIASSEVTANQQATSEIELRPLWRPQENGWYSGDHHFHLNYGGPYSLRPEDLLPILKGEGLDVATPQVANLRNRLKDLEWWGWRCLEKLPIILFAQEIRPHFLGHIGLVGTHSLFWPWGWGPGFPVYSKDDRPNSEALQHARREGGINSYVHPVFFREPFESPGIDYFPLALIADGVNGDVDSLEIACLWTDELGTSKLWYQFLNLGIPIAPIAGTDAFPNFYRCMTVGTTRVYVRLEGPFNWMNYLTALRKGLSFVTTGPMLDFYADGKRPGEIVVEGGKTVNWNLNLYSATAVEKVEILVNGNVLWSETGLEDPGKRTYSGEIEIPEGGWIAARAFGGKTGWPVMDSYPFAHSAPVWIAEIGSTSQADEKASARELLNALNEKEKSLKSGYEGVAIPKLLEQFQKARKVLEARIQE